MRGKEAFFGATAAALLAAGCSGFWDQGPREDDSVDKCRGNATNVEPTYVISEEGYSPATDPNVLKGLQVEAIEAGTYDGSAYGIGTLVCKVAAPDAKGNWFNNEPSTWVQVLSQRGVDTGRMLEDLDSIPQ
jgi:hypothetical protein